MAPRSVNYKSGSIVYFINDKSDSVFLLKEGKVKLVSIDVETGNEITDFIATGEFFGVKSGLIRYPREETATTVQPSTVIEFSTPEFEALITKNTTIILKMLKAFSNQLRRIGKQVQSIVGNKVSTNPSDDLFQIGDYYLKNKKYRQSITVYKRYLQYYPEGKYSKITGSRLSLAEGALSSYGEGGGPTPVLESITEGMTYNIPDIPDIDTTPPEGSYNSEEEKTYYKGVSLMSQDKFIEGFNEFKKVLSMNNEKLKMQAGFEI
ncbi:MAG TPA: Crp/Fnr family transcriptional regulator, partial [Spirochaetota bacterium]|nr:Crp/Fnr family transcriptional regulator [Spirochaetota bacterium]